jgi:signal transduction histidine kinase
MLARHKFGTDMSRTAKEKIPRINHQQNSTAVIETIFDAIGRGVIFTNVDGFVTHMNSAAEEMLDVERGSIIGKKVYMLPLRTPVYRVLSENCRDTHVDITVKGRVYAILASEVRNRQGAMLGEMTELWEITERKKEKRQWEAFVAMITHDLKSPVTVINGYLQMMKMGVYGSLSKKICDVIDQMDLSGSRLLSMIEELLESYQLEVGYLNLSRERCDIGKILKGCFSDNLNEAREKNIDFKLSIDEGIPLVNVDSKQFTRVFNNLIGNAVKFTPTGGTVSVSAGAANGNLNVRVEDTGIGIPGQDLSRVFNKYFRSAAASGYKGSGLGLAISRAIVEAHDGAVKVESREGKGSSFTVMISLSEE